MRPLALVLSVLLATSTGWAQPLNAPAQQAPQQTQSATPAPPPAGPQDQAAESNSQPATITIPAGTHISLNLASPLSSKARAGSSVRAVVAFPVTVGTQMAIPVGTYVQGVIDKISQHGQSGPSVQMHFTQILFSSGYTVPLSGNTDYSQLIPPPTPYAVTSAQLIAPESYFPGTGDFDSQAGAHAFFAPVAMQSQQPPQPPPLPSHKGLIIGTVVGFVAVLVVTFLLMSRHAGRNFILFDTGWQFEMVLQSPLTLDTASVKAALAASPVH